MLQHQLKGEHAIGDKGVKFKWVGSYLTMEKVRPDNHQMLAYGVEDEKLPSNEYNISRPMSSLSAGALRWWTRTNEKNLNWNFFPSANLTYSLTPAMNLRVAYAKSIIRPDLREMSFFREYDFELGGNYNINLVKSTIAHHYDFRYEWYPGAGEVMSVSLCYKKFNYSMEIYNDEGSGNMFELKNNKSSRNYGLEVELRKSLAFTKVPFIRNFALYGNFTALKSFVTPIDVNYNGLDPNNLNKVVPQETIRPEEERPQTGASNYMVYPSRLKLLS